MNLPQIKRGLRTDALAGMLVGACLLLAPASARSQIRLGLRAEHTSVLQFEAVRVFITIYNDSADLLVADPSPKVANFVLRPLVIARDGRPAALVGKAPFLRRLRVMPDREEVVMREMSAWCDMVRTGRYLMTVLGTWKGGTYESNQAMVTVVPGLQLTSLEKPLTGYDDRTRRYSLRYWKRGRWEHLFLRVDQLEDSMNYGVFELGPLLRLVKPTLEVDRGGNIKTVHQSGPDCFTRSVFKSEPTEVRFINQTYHLADGRPYPKARKSETD